MKTTLYINAEVHYCFTDSQWLETKTVCERIKGRELTDSQFAKIIDKILMQQTHLQELSLFTDQVLNA